MQQKIRSLSRIGDINSLPEGHLHSKISFLKSIINEQKNPEVREMKQRMFKLSYTVKNIGIHGEEIGISSKRMPFKQKQQFKPSEIQSEKQKFNFTKKYLPQNSFYSQALIPIKKNKPSEQDKNTSSHNPFLLTTSKFMQNQIAQTNHIHPQTKFSKKIQSKHKFDKNSSNLLRFKTFSKNESSRKEQQFIEKITSIRKTTSQNQLKNTKTLSNKKSFAKLLGEFGNKKNDLQIQPLQHQGNPLFKKIKKLQEMSSNKKQLQNHEQFLNSRKFYNSTSSLSSRYQTMISTTRQISSRKISTKID